MGRDSTTVFECDHCDSDPHDGSGEIQRVLELKGDHSMGSALRRGWSCVEFERIKPGQQHTQPYQQERKIEKTLLLCPGCTDFLLRWGVEGPEAPRRRSSLA